MNNHTFCLILIVIGCGLSLTNQSSETSIAVITTASTYLQATTKKND